MSDTLVRIRRADPPDLSVLENLLQFYVYDFSEIIGDGPRAIDLNAQGRFNVQISLAPYWREPEHFAELIYCGSVLAGFALINTSSHHGGRIERNMAEFFVARRFRRMGVATQAVHQIVAKLPGSWEAAIMSENTAALAFWPRALGSSQNISGLASRSGDGVNWTGPIWSFRSRPA